MITFTDVKTGKQIAVYEAETYQYGSKNQKRLSSVVSAKYILVTGDNRGRLPDWVRRILKTNNLWFRKIGRTTYVSNTFALIPGGIGGRAP
jgi:hypothetical protein